MASVFHLSGKPFRLSDLHMYVKEGRVEEPVERPPQHDITCTGSVNPQGVIDGIVASDVQAIAVVYMNSQGGVEVASSFHNPDVVSRLFREGIALTDQLSIETLAEEAASGPWYKMGTSWEEAGQFHGTYEVPEDEDS